MKEIKCKNDLDNAIKEHDYVIVDCTASWCSPCKKIAPKIEKLSKKEEYNEVSFYVYDIDEDDELTEEYIEVVPTFLFFKEGELVKEIKGSNYNKVVEQLDNMLEDSESESDSE